MLYCIALFLLPCYINFLCTPYGNVSTKRVHARPRSFQPHPLRPPAPHTHAHAQPWPKRTRISVGTHLIRIRGGVNGRVRNADTWSLIVRHELFRLAEQMLRPRTGLQTPAALIFNGVQRAKDAFHFCSVYAQSLLAISPGRTGQMFVSCFLFYEWTIHLHRRPLGMLPYIINCENVNSMMTQFV